MNPKHETLLGHRCYPSITAVPDEIDLAIIALPASLVEQEIDAVHEKGIRRIILISSGFAEAGAEGIRNAAADRGQRRRRYGIRVIGPNALGVYNTDNGLDSFFVSRERVSRPAPGRLSIISQSGAITVILMEALARDGMGIAKAVNYGNRLDVDDADALDYFADDPQTGAVAMYMESVADGRKFLNAAKAFAAKKPLVIWKAGKHETGRGSRGIPHGNACRELRALPGGLPAGRRSRGLRLRPHDRRGKGRGAHGLSLHGRTGCWS